MLRTPRFRPLMLLLALSMPLIWHGPSWAQKKHDKGATDTEWTMGFLVNYRV